MVGHYSKTLATPRHRRPRTGGAVTVHYTTRTHPATAGPVPAERWLASYQSRLPHARHRRPCAGGAMIGHYRRRHTPRHRRPCAGGA